MLKGWEGYIHRHNVLTKLTIFVKVFHGQRKTHRIEVSILDKISVIEDRLLELEKSEIQQYKIAKLVYPMGSLRNMHNYFE